MSVRLNESGSRLRRTDDSGFDLLPDLNALCADRQEERTEIFAPNAWYGAASTIRAYCGWPRDRPLPILLPHGVELSADCLYGYETSSRLPAIYSFPAYRDQAYRSGSGKIVVPGCSPWLYLDRTAIGQVGARQFVLMMPAHSSLDYRAELGHTQFAQTIERAYPGEELWCCMYWRDVQHGCHSHYIERGIPVTSAGHIYDSGFWLRLAQLFARAKLMVTNEFGSHVFYAAAHGVPVIVRGDVDVAWTGPNDPIPRKYDSERNAKEFADIEPLFRNLSPNVDRQRAVAEMMLGGERKSSTEELRSLLEELWRSPGFRSRVLLRWRIGTLVAPARALLQEIRR